MKGHAIYPHYSIDKQFDYLNILAQAAINLGQKNSRQFYILYRRPIWIDMPYNP